MFITGTGVSNHFEDLDCPAVEALGLEIAGFKAGGFEPEACNGFLGLDEADGLGIKGEAGDSFEAVDIKQFDDFGVDKLEQFNTEDLGVLKLDGFGGELGGEDMIEVLQLFWERLVERMRDLIDEAQDLLWGGAFCLGL
ncbi:hypothetical protein V5O48_015548 [Marasmius crinis-equi]|uniref:Uncharacterized protein n=1 Tax=Marasmius crinis-equi TaxID=585013 RepID=A0ABR3EU83_9AGAR